MEAVRSRNGGKGRRTRRAPRGTGEKRILDAAAKFFAEHGFRASTRLLASELGVTQALLYRYFPSKQALIDRVFETTFIDRWDQSRTEGLLDFAKPLRQRLIDFYSVNAKRSAPVRSRLFMRANLDDQRLADLYTSPLNERILFPLISALRQAADLPPLGAKPALRAERELVMTLHGGLAHLHIRRNIYNSPLPKDLTEHIEFYVDCFLAGALTTINGLHEKKPSGFLGKRLGGRKGLPIE
jgi:AcrR family transcriptional regulator